MARQSDYKRHLKKKWSAMFNRPLCSKTFISDTKFGTLNRRTPNGFSGGVRGIMNEERNLSSFTYLIVIIKEIGISQISGGRL